VRQGSARIRKATGQRLFGTGFPMGVESTDSFQSFLSWVDAYNVKLVDDNGKLLVDDPKVKAGLVSALTTTPSPISRAARRRRRRPGRIPTTTSPSTTRRP